MNLQNVLNSLVVAALIAVGGLFLQVQAMAGDVESYRDEKRQRQETRDRLIRVEEGAKRQDEKLDEILEELRAQRRRSSSPPARVAPVPREPTQ